MVICQELITSQKVLEGVAKINLKKIMPIAINVTRPKLTSSNTVNVNIDFDPNTLVNTDEIEFRVFLDNVTIDPIVIDDMTNISYTTGSAVITGQAGDFLNARAGDVVTTTSGDFVGLSVVSVIADGSTMTLDGNPTATADVGTTNDLTITPGDLDTTLYYLKVKNIMTGNLLKILPTISLFNGASASEGASADDSDNLTYDDGVVTTFAEQSINMDQYLTNIRVSRTDS